MALQTCLDGGGTGSGRGPAAEASCYSSGTAHVMGVLYTRI